jgi:class 3 adenylate cyclase/tetratricopeptide (TPR) repeat protein
VICPNCSSPIQRGQNFCANCGTDLRALESSDIRSPAERTPGHLAARILADRDTLVGERKWVTVMFADIVGSTSVIEDNDPEEAARFLTGALEGMMDAIHEFEGTVNELRGDGLMALFGAPIAHEDHAVRAARAALAIPERVRQRTDGQAITRVGLHTGEVLVRSVNNDLSMEYQAVGPTVHLAARMESLAEPGKTLVTDDVNDLLLGRVETESLGPVDVKGLSAPIPAFQLDHVIDTTRWSVREIRGLTEFVGRSAEMSRLQEAVDDLSRGIASNLALVGEGGVGKSRLVHRITIGQSDSSTVVMAESSPFDVNTPYYPIRAFLHGWLGTKRGDAEIPERLSISLGEINSDLLRHVTPLASLLGRPPTDESHWDQMDPQQRRRHVQAAIRSTIQTMAEQRPLIVVFEDLHWIDSETTAVINDLVSGSGALPILVLLTYRPEFLPTWQEGAVEEIHIDVMSERSALAMVDRLLGPDPSVADLKPLVAGRAAGTPLFLEETVRALHDGGAITGEKGSYVAVSEDTEIEIPDSVQSALAARIDRLAGGDKKVLQVAAVAGEDVPEELLREVVGPGDLAIEDSLDSLQNREFIFRSKAAPHAEYCFSHALIRDVAYGSVPKAQRKAIHADMVRLLEESSDHVPLERLAYHSLEGELWKKAVHYSSESADKSIKDSAYGEASRFLRDAAWALEEVPQTPDVVRMAIDIRMRLRVAETGARGGLARLSADLAEAAQLAASIDDQVREARVAVHLGYTENMLGNAAQSEGQAMRASELAAELDDRYLEVESQILLAQTHAYAGRPGLVPDLLLPHMGYLTEEVRHETMDQTMIRSVVACAHLATSFAAANDAEASGHWRETGILIADEAGRPFDQMYMQFAAGTADDLLGDYETAVLAHERSARIGDEHDIWFMKTFAQTWRGHSLLMAGRLEEARRVLDQAVMDARENEMPYVEFSCRAVRSRVSYNSGDVESALADATAAVDFGDEKGLPLLKLFALPSLDRADEAAALAASCGFSNWEL